ncbi:hypothetical protein M0804_013264 [Polistes exclamans]|nr:hypothetical protein M0804_013264 [Polistes exclamans]
MSEKSTLTELAFRILERSMKFNPENGNFKEWKRTFEILMRILHISEDRKSYLLLKMLHHSVFIYIHKLIFPVDPFDLSYDMTMSILENKYSN